MGGRSERKRKGTRKTANRLFTYDESTHLDVHPTNTPTTTASSITRSSSNYVRSVTMEEPPMATSGEDVPSNVVTLSTDIDDNSDADSLASAMFRDDLSSLAQLIIPFSVMDVFPTSSLPTQTPPSPKHYHHPTELSVSFEDPSHRTFSSYSSHGLNNHNVANNETVEVKYDGTVHTIVSSHDVLHAGHGGRAVDSVTIIKDGGDLVFSGKHSRSRGKQPDWETASLTSAVSSTKIKSTSSLRTFAWGTKRSSLSSLPSDSSGIAEQQQGRRIISRLRKSRAPPQQQQDQSDAQSLRTTNSIVTAYAALGGLFVKSKRNESNPALQGYMSLNQSFSSSQVGQNRFLRRPKPGRSLRRLRGIHDDDFKSSPMSKTRSSASVTSSSSKPQAVFMGADCQRSNNGGMTLLFQPQWPSFGHDHEEHDHDPLPHVHITVETLEHRIPVSTEKCADEEDRDRVITSVDNLDFWNQGTATRDEPPHYSRSPLRPQGYDNKYVFATEFPDMNENEGKAVVPDKHNSSHLHPPTLKSSSHRFSRRAKRQPPMDSIVIPLLPKSDDDIGVESCFTPAAVAITATNTATSLPASLSSSWRAATSLFLRSGGSAVVSSNRNDHDSETSSLAEDDSIDLVDHRLQQSDPKASSNQVTTEPPTPHLRRRSISWLRRNSSSKSGGDDDHHYQKDDANRSISSLVSNRRLGSFRLGRGRSQPPALDSAYPIVREDYSLNDGSYHMLKVSSFASSFAS